MASAETNQVLTKYVMGNRQEFDELKERFEGMDDWSAPAAAALAYLIAKDELEAEKEEEEEEEEESDVYDAVVKFIEDHSHHLTALSAHAMADQIFTVIYEWLDKSLAEKNYGPLGAIRGDIEELFLPFAIARPKA